MLNCHISTILILFLISIVPPSSCDPLTRHLTTTDTTTDQSLSEIPLYSNFQYYLVPSYISNNGASAINITGIPLLYPMILALYTSQTIIATNCTAFLNYTSPCQSFLCNNASQSPQNLSLPYFQAQGITASTQIAWNTSTLFDAPVFVTSSCIIGNNSYYGQHLLGLIGMGTSNSQGIPPISSYFSIYLTQSFLGNKLLLYFDPTKAQSSTPVAVLESDGNWAVNQIDSIQVGDDTLDVSGISLIFDMNSVANYFPQQLYDFIMDSLQQDFTCYASENDNLLESADANDTDTYDNSDAPFPICAYNLANIDSLPTITITSGDQEILIPPRIYVGQGFGVTRNITLNIITTEVDSFSRYYVTPDFQDNIILGSTFMTCYYTLFDATNGGNTISLYLANQNAVSSSIQGTSVDNGTGATSGGSNVLMIVFASLFGVMLIVSLVAGYWIWRMRKQNMMMNVKKEKEIAMVTLQVPLATGLTQSGFSNMGSSGSMNSSGKSATSDLST